ncbi:MAG: hypothetical protein ACK4MF_07860, partial [Hyphomicrobiaceae bacterium]
RADREIRSERAAERDEFRDYDTRVPYVSETWSAGRIEGNQVSETEHQRRTGLLAHFTRHPANV